MHPDKVPLAFGIKISPHHHTPLAWFYFSQPNSWFDLNWKTILWKVHHANL